MFLIVGPSGIALKGTLWEAVYAAIATRLATYNVSLERGCLSSKDERTFLPHVCVIQKKGALVK